MQHEAAAAAAAAAAGESAAESSSCFSSPSAAARNASDGVTRKRLAIVGGGPIGVELALSALERGFSVTVFESGNCAGAHVISWQHVTLFSPWSMNMSDTGRRVLQTLGLPVPDSDACPTGSEFCAFYLQPLARHVQAHPKCSAWNASARVLSIARDSLLKGDSSDPHAPAGKSPARNSRAFRLLVRHDDCGGAEKFHGGFDFVCDCSGAYGEERGNWCGPGGISACGERQMRLSRRIWCALPDIAGAQRNRFAGRRTLVVGSGMSAATALSLLTQVASASPGTEILFVTRASCRPFPIVENDVLPQRKALCSLGNSAASGGIPCVTHIGGCSVMSFRQTADDLIQVDIADPEQKDAVRVETVHEVITCCGFRPDTSIFEELQVHLCYASDGPMGLAASLLGSSGDCLQQQFSGPDVLRNPEPDFFILGAKSYGRNSKFLLSLGHKQVDAALQLMCSAS